MINAHYGACNLVLNAPLYVNCQYEKREFIQVDVFVGRVFVKYYQGQHGSHVQYDETTDSTMKMPHFVPLRRHIRPREGPKNVLLQASKMCPLRSILNEHKWLPHLYSLSNVSM